ncbi:hypothetical protein [Rickettsia australis]|uniref:hypothetical protein n=1 Tax=Rickettsia australis TaxID=787 RepID=UPI0002D7A7CF
MQGLKSIFGVIPWLDHGIQKIVKNTNIGIFNWIPRSSRGMTAMASLRTTMPCLDNRSSSIQNNQVESQISQNEAKALLIYTVLVSLYKELSKLRSIIKNISLIKLYKR